MKTTIEKPATNPVGSGVILRLIVNADDLGENRIVNDATLELMASGRITSATIMGNGPDTGFLRTRLSRHRHCSFGVHLNASQHAPLTSGRGLELLVNGDGEMVRLGRPIPAAPQLLRALYNEFCAQVEAVGRLGVTISHLDSHHHVHTQAAVFPVLKAVQRRYRIQRIRISKNLYLPQDVPGVRLLQKKGLYNWCIRHVYGAKTTEYFTEFSTFHRLLEGASLPPISSLEAMVHPGSPKFAEETALLQQSNWIDLLPDGSKLISYTDLH